MLINSTNEMKHEAHGTQQPRYINKIGEDVRPRNEVIRSCSQLISFSLMDGGEYLRQVLCWRV